MITLKKTGIFMQYDEERACISSLKGNHREFIGEELPIFKLLLRDEMGESQEVHFEDMRFASAHSTENSMVATYEGETLEVVVSACIGDSVDWKIAVHMKDNRIVEWIDFPRIAVPHDLKDNNGDSKILWGYNEGAIVDDLSYKESEEFNYKDLQYPSISCIPMYPAIVESQFMAYYNSKEGVYFGAHDKEDNIKGIDFLPYKNGILLQMRHYCGGHYGEDYQMSFPMVMKFFEGEWQDAAQIYKDWFKANKAEPFVKITENKELPDWYSQSPVIITYPVRGLHDGDIMNPNKMFPYCNAMEHVERLEKALNSKIMVILMHWEGTAPWAPPYVWPPYGGEEELKKFIDALHERGDVFGVYCSGLGWTQFSKLVDDYNREAEFEEKNLRDAMCLSPKQELPYCCIVDCIRAGYDMCPTQRFTIDVLKNEVEHMVAAGIDYIQLMDQNHGGTSYFCYSKEHGHPPVPGKWQVEAVKELLAEVEQGTGKVLFGCESAAAESYIPYLLFSDNRYELNYATGRPVPLYAYLYHEYINNFMGNQVSAHKWLDHAKSPVNLLERTAYAFSAGDMLTLVLNENGDIAWNWGWRELDDIPNQDDIITFVKNANMWRQGIGKKYLHSGNMVKPYKVLCDNNLIYAPKGHEFVIEKIHTSAWETESGQYGQFLINYNPEEVECEICLPDGRYKLYEDDHNFVMIQGGCQKINVKKLSTVMIERE